MFDWFGKAKDWISNLVKQVKTEWSNIKNGTGDTVNTPRGEIPIDTAFGSNVINSALSTDNNRIYDSNINNLINPSSANDYSRESDFMTQREILDWQKEMSDTSHQRETQDLIAAGLNPVLSANSGASAYTASGSTGSLDVAKLQAATTLAAAQINANSATNVARIYTEADKNNSYLNLASNVIGNILGIGKTALGSYLDYKLPTTRYNYSNSKSQNTTTYYRRYY